MSPSPLDIFISRFLWSAHRILAIFIQRRLYLPEIWSSAADLSDFIGNDLRAIIAGIPPDYYYSAEGICFVNMTMSKSTTVYLPHSSLLDNTAYSVNKVCQHMERLLSSSSTKEDTLKQQGNSESNNRNGLYNINCIRKLRRKEDHSLLKFLALNALELAAPASDILLRQNATTTTINQNEGNEVNNKCKPSQCWFQLSGHPDCFAPAGPGTVWKKCSGGTERAVYEALSKEPALRDIVPRYLREVQYSGETFIELQDLLHGFQDPNVMDIKMGTRTFLESEVQNTFAREDLFLKMIAVDPNAPTSEEYVARAVTKLRYMQFREEQSSTNNQGFRIEALKFRGSKPVTDLKKVKSRQDVSDTLSLFLGNREDVRQRLIARMKEIYTKLDQSHYFKTHEIVGSSIFVVYDDTKVGAWLIDFAKTRPAPPDAVLTHKLPWSPGNHEEGFLFGMDRLITILEDIKIVEDKKTDPPKSAVALKS